MNCLKGVYVCGYVYVRVVVGQVIHFLLLYGNDRDRALKSTFFLDLYHVVSSIATQLLSVVWNEGRMREQIK